MAVWWEADVPFRQLGLSTTYATGINTTVTTSALASHRINRETMHDRRSCEYRR
jgi:hypothetical protein